MTPTINIAGGGGVAQTSRDVDLVNSPELSLVSTKEKSTEEKVSFSFQI